MTKINTFALSALVASISLMGCKGTGTQKEILYNNYTGTDTEGFNFLKESYHHAGYQQFAAKHIDDQALANAISTTYAEISQNLIELGNYNNVLIPSINEVSFEEAAISENTDSLTVVENSLVDSLATIETTVDPQTEISIEKIIGSQEKLIHQFENASENTNRSIRQYAQETLPKLEELLEQTKATIK